MATDPSSAPVSAPAAQLTGKLDRFWSRSLAIAAAVVFIISAVFPIVAAFVQDTESWPKWWGVLDVSIAFILAALVFAVLALTHGKVNKQAEDAGYRAYRILIHAIFVVLVVFALFGDRVIWNNCLTGLAWRFWLLLYALPAWFAIFTATSRPA